jgi:hypothetical protein
LDYRLSTYFVPWLNLFPEKDASGAPLGGHPAPSDPKRFAISGLTPPLRRCEAELQVLYDIKNEKPGKIAIEYDPTLFAITGSGTSGPTQNSGALHEYIIPYKTYGITPKNYQESVKVAETIKIKCLREINAEFHTLEVVAYSFENGMGSSPRLMKEGTIVGKLNVCGNAKLYRKEVKITLVRVTTDIRHGMPPTVLGGSQGPVTGEFTPADIEAMFHTLHQALITPDVINLDNNGKEYILDLSLDPKFHLASAPGGFIKPVPVNPSNPSGGIVDPTSSEFQDYIIDEFKRQHFRTHYPATTPTITDRFLAFAFAEKAPVGGIAFEQLEKESLLDVAFSRPMYNVWRPATAIFNHRYDETLAHEQLHALTLRHTHSDWEATPNRYTCITPNCKYIFPFMTTTNVMSYNHRNMYSTWRWQWKIMQNNVNINWMGKKG